MRACLAALAGVMALAAYVPAALADPPSSSPPSSSPSSSSPAARPADTPEEIAAARSYADAMIAEGSAAAWSQNATDSALAVVRHRPTGVECAFSQGGRGNGVRASRGSTQAPGDDIACFNDDPQLHIQTFTWIVRLRGPTTLDEQMGLAVQALRAAHATLEPWRGSAIQLGMGGPGPPPPPIATRRFSYSEGGHRFYLRADIAVVNGWMIAMRTTGPADDDTVRMGTEISAALTMNMHVLQMRDHLAGAPAAAR